MKKAIAIVVLGLLLCNYGNTEEPDLGMATFGFSCDPILGKAKDKIYIGFVKEDGFFFRLGLDEQENAFFSIEDTPLYFESINDKDHSLKDVYIWYDIWVIESKVMPIWFHNVLYYDENKQKHFYSINHFNIASDDKKLRKAAKRKNKFYMMQATDNLTEQILKKIEDGFVKVNKSLFKLFSPMYGSPISASKLKKLGQDTRQTNLYICEEL